VMRAEDAGPSLEILAFDACRLAAGLVEAAEAERLRSMSGLGRIAPTARFVRGLIAARQLRSERFGPLLAPDTGWSVMLALYAAHLEGWELTLAQLAEAAGTAAVPARLPALESKNLLHRRPDPDDPRGTIVALTEEGAAKMGDYLREAREI
jgi:DNA-binding MarR family transcriptional regulator